MSTRVHSNIGHVLGRQLGRPFSSKAIGTTNPNSLRGSKPSPRDAMGHVGGTGLFTFAHDGASQAFTVFMWSSMLNAQDPAQGWVKLGAVSAEYTKTVDPYSASSITAPERSLIFIMAGSSACDNCWMGGAMKPAGNITPDLR